MRAILPRWFHHWGCHLHKITSTVGAIYLIQVTSLMGTIHMLSHRMTSSMVVPYLRWLHQWVLSRFKIQDLLRGVEWVHGVFLFPLVLVVATCKIGSFLCSLDNLLQKNVIVLRFGNQISKGRSLEKRAIFDLLVTFSSHQGKVTKIPSARISLTYIHVFCSPYWPFLPYQFWKKIQIYQVRFLFGMSPGVDSYSRHFGTIDK